MLIRSLTQGFSFTLESQPTPNHKLHRLYTMLTFSHDHRPRESFTPAQCPFWAIALASPPKLTGNNQSFVAGLQPAGLDETKSIYRNPDHFDPERAHTGSLVKDVCWTAGTFDDC
jgi:hypothetical protein